MKRTFIHALMITASLALAAPASASGYVVYAPMDNEDLESTSQQAPAKDFKGNETPKPAALLAPEVRKKREGAANNTSKGKKKGNVEYHWKVEEGTK
ncbi:MAG: hypothetical protein R6X15_04170 [Pseudomonadota bacterium]